MLDLRIIPDRSVPAAALTIVGMEAILGIVLLINWKPRVSGVISFAVLLLFTVVLTRAYRQGKTGGCGCFGSRIDQHIGKWTFVRNSLAMILALVVFLGPSPQLNPLAIVVPVIIAALGTSIWFIWQQRTSDEAPNILPTLNPIIPLSRRTFLRQAGTAGIGFVGLGILQGLTMKSALAAQRLPEDTYNQNYDHNESVCGTFGCSAFNRRNHQLVRWCSDSPSCSVGQWSQWGSSCVTCECACDSITPCVPCCDCCDPCACFDC